MPIVDCHVHLYPPEINAHPAAWAQTHGENHWATLCARVRKSGVPVQGFPRVKDLLEAMDAAQVERAILQGWYWENHDTCRLQNRFYAECVRAFPDRLSACATIHPSVGAAEIGREIRWAVENGFCGLGELSPHSQMFSPDDAGWHDTLRLCAEWKLPVLLHVTEPSTKPYPGRVRTPLADFLQMAQEHADVIFVLAHWGARLPFDPVLGTAITACRNVFFDTAASPLLYSPEVFPEMIARVGSERILFGSDFPLILYPTSETEPAISSFLTQVKVLGLRAADRAAILGESARSVFKI